MTKKREVKFTEANAVKAWVLYNTPGSGTTRGQIGEKFGVGAGAIDHWIKKVEDNPALLARAKDQLKRKTKPLPYSEGGPAESPLERSVDKIIALEEENKFLKWWNEGERSGWVNELLKRIGRTEE